MSAGARLLAGLGLLTGAAVIGACAAPEPTPQPAQSIPGAAAPAPTAGRPEPLPLEPPARDLRDLAVRLGGRPVPEVEPPPTVQACELGWREPFWVHDIENQRYFEIEAVVRAVTEHACVWVQEGQPYSQGALEEGAKTFSDDIIAPLATFFAHELEPGIDGDPRVHVLHHESIPGVAGFFSSADAVPASVNPYSNARELFYVNLSSYRPGSYDYLSLLAHELQHLIHHETDRDEAGWVNEGLSELAPHLVGYGAQGGATFFAYPDTALQEWQPESGANAAHYAASYAFFAYLRARFGDDVIAAVAAAPRNGAAGVEQALEVIGRELPFDDVFRDWTVANLVGGTSRTGLDARFDYGGAVTGAVVPEDLPPDGVSATVAQYGADYWDATTWIEGGRLRLRFEGQPHVGLLELQPAREGRVWWSGRGDGANSRLTGTFDLSGASEATLAFRLWHELERGWDYGYLSASRDGGATWERLALSGSSDDDRNGVNYGDGLTGATAGWIEESVDLDAFAGGPLALRFETVTDETVNLAGMAVDDIRIEAIGFADDAEADAPGPWLAEGWARIDPLVAQRWSLQVVVDTADGIRVLPVAVAEDGAADVELGPIPDDATVTLVVSGLTAGTRHAAGYALEPAG